MKKKILICLVAVFSLFAANFCVGFKPAFAEETKYCGAGGFTEESETINYSRKETTSYNIIANVPNYYRQTENSGCAVIAGTILIGYYDRLCEELIPNYKTYVKIGSSFRYSSPGFETQAVMEELFVSMETDASTGGTTYNGFHKGMKSYVNNRGYSYTTEGLGNLDFNKYKSAVENNRPVAVFLSNYSYARVGEDNGSSEVVKSIHSTVAHVVVGCGYKVDTYYNASGQVITTRTYLKVASGSVEYGLTYLCLDGKSKIDKSDSIIIQ